MHGVKQDRLICGERCRVWSDRGGVINTGIFVKYRNSCAVISVDGGGLISVEGRLVTR